MVITRISTRKTLLLSEHIKKIAIVIYVVIFPLMLHFLSFKNQFVSVYFQTEKIHFSYKYSSFSGEFYRVSEAISFIEEKYYVPLLSWLYSLLRALPSETTVTLCDTFWNFLSDIWSVLTPVSLIMINIEPSMPVPGFNTSCIRYDYADLYTTLGRRK